jgi:hypothetical protein
VSEPVTTVRRRMPLDGTDAQALEHALAQVEDIAAKLLVERDEARRLLLTRVEATRLDEATLAHEYLLKEHRLALSENAGMRGVLESFIGTAEAAIRHQETKNKGGQQVPFFGDFHESTPSTAARLRWWKKRMEKALEGPSPEPPQRNGCTRLSTEKGVDVCRNCGGKRSEHPLAKVP